MSFTAKQIAVTLLVVCATVVPACQSNSPEKTNAISRSESAAILAETLLASEEMFLQAMHTKDPLGMIDAALTRDDIITSGIYAYGNSEVVAENTDRMIDLALSYAARDEVILAEATQRLDSRKPRKHSGTFGGDGFLKQLGNMSRPDEYVRTLEIDALSSFTMRLPIKKAVGAIIYVEHREFFPIFLTVIDNDGTPLCEQRNPRGRLLCRWQSMEDTEVTVTVDNGGSLATDVLMIRNQ